MKKLFEKIKNHSFWVSLSASLILFLNALSKAFGFEFENQIVEDCIMSFAGLLTVFGIVTMKENGKKEPEDKNQEASPNEDKQEDESNKNDE